MTIKLHAPMQSIVNRRFPLAGGVGSLQTSFRLSFLAPTQRLGKAAGPAAADFTDEELEEEGFEDW